MSATDPMEIGPLLRRLELAERALLVYGWTGTGSGSPRDKALYELWADWLHEYRRQGMDESPKAHPELSEDRINELAARRDAAVARFMSAFDAMIEEPSV